MDFLDLLLKIWETIWWLLTWSPSHMDGVNMALGPLAIGALAGGALGIGNYIAGTGERRRLRRRRRRFDALRDTAGEGVETQIQDILGRAAGIETDATAEDIYGQSIQALTDRVQAGQSGTGAQLAKALMAGGGDLTGSLNTTLQKLTAAGNRSIQDIMSEYNERVDRRNLQQRSRQDRLLSRALGAQQSQFGTYAGLAEGAMDRSTYKSTADKQFLMDSIGLGGNIGAILKQNP